jgi:PIN domain nuclease of toxin-antitoxin system
MKQFILDTHTVEWYLSAPKKLGREAARLLSLVDHSKALALIPAIVPIELTLVREAGRKVVGPMEIEALLRANPHFELAPMDIKQTIEFMLLGGIRDPFNRMVVAAARTLGAPLLTVDENITRSGLIEVIWD